MKDIEMEAGTKPSTDNGAVLLGRAVDALITAQTMEDAVRNITRPLVEIADAFPIVSALDACLDKLAAEVDPCIDDLQRALGVVGSSPWPDLPRGTSATNLAGDVADNINTGLLDLATLMRAARAEAGALALGEIDNDDGGVTSRSSRACRLIDIAEERVRVMLKTLAPHV